MSTAFTGFVLLNEAKFDREKFLKAITSIGHRHQICCWIQFLKETNFYLSKNICQDRKLYITNEILEIAKKI